jgi:signal transduction histidine kinase
MNNLYGIFWYLLTCFLSISNIVAFKYLFSIASVFDIYFIKSIVALICVSIFIFHNKINMTANWRKYIILSIIWTATSLLWFFPLQFVSLSEGLNIRFFSPLVTYLLGIIILKEKSSWSTFSLLLITVIVIFWMILGSITHTVSAYILYFLIFASCISASFRYSYFKKIVEKFKDTKTIFYYNTLYILISIPLVKRGGLEALFFDYTKIILIILLAISSIFVVYSLKKAYSYTDISKLQPFYYSRLLLGYLAAHYLFKEKLAIWNIIGIIFIILTSRLIKIIKQYEKQLKKQIELEKEKKDELIKIKKIQDKFFANITHELKTPLTGIILYSEIIKYNKLRKNLDPEYAELADNILSCSKRLTNLINKVLNISKINNNKMSLSKQYFDFESFILQCILSVKPLAENKNIEIKIKKPNKQVNFFGDREKLYIVFENILSNAIKFIDTKDKKGLIHVEYKIVNKNRKNYLQIIVSDNGIGIAKKDIGKVFSEYDQITNGYTRQHNKQGTGLGLPLSKKMVELHDGMLKIKSRLNNGTSIIISLPMNKNNDEKKDNSSRR